MVEEIVRIDMQRYAKAIGVAIIAGAGLLAEGLLANGITLGDDWPQLVGSVLAPIVAFILRNK